MNVKYIRRKCGVRGCKNIGSFSLSRNREMGNSIIMCKECMELALAAANEYKDEPKPKASSGIPTLFFPEAARKPEEADSTEIAKDSETQAETETENEPAVKPRTTRKKAAK